MVVLVKGRSAEIQGTIAIGSQRHPHYVAVAGGLHDQGLSDLTGSQHRQHLPAGFRPVSTAATDIREKVHQSPEGLFI